MSRNTSLKASVVTFKEPMATNLTLNNIQFQEPQIAPLHKNNSSNSVRKIIQKPAIDLNATHTNMTLQNFLPYAHINSTKSRGTPSVLATSNTHLESADNNKNINNVHHQNTKVSLLPGLSLNTVKGPNHNVEPEKSNEIGSSSHDPDKENNRLIANKPPKKAVTYSRRPQPQESFYVKAIKAGRDLHMKPEQRKSSHSEENDTKENSQAAEEPKAENEQQWTEELSFKDNWPEKSGNADEINITPDKKKFDFTLGVFTPEKVEEPQHNGFLSDEKRFERPKESESKAWEQTLRVDKSKRKSKFIVPEPQMRVKTEVETPVEIPEDHEQMARTHLSKNFGVLNDLKQSKATKEETLTRIRAGLEAIQSQKSSGPESQQKISRLEEAVMKLKSEYERQGEVLDALIGKIYTWSFMSNNVVEMVHETKTSPKNEEYGQQQRGSGLIMGGRHGLVTQSHLYSDPKKNQNGGLSDSKMFGNLHAANKRSMVNLYHQGLPDLELDPTKKSHRPPPLEEETPSFANRNFKPGSEPSFGNMFLSPVKPLPKVPRVNDPTRQERVYSSPITSFVGGSQMLPIISGTKSTKSGTAEATTRQIDMRDINNRKVPLAFGNFGNDITRFDTAQARDTLRNPTLNRFNMGITNGREDGLTRRVTETELRKKDSAPPNLPLLPGLGKFISENSHDRLDSLEREELRFGNELRKHIVESEAIRQNGDSYMLPQITDTKKKEKILKEVFSLKWKKKSNVY